MSPSEFQREYLGTFIEDKNESLLCNIAENYFSRCDSYDARVCTSTSERSGEPIPSNGYELALINRHARMVIEELSQRYHLPHKTIFSAIQRYSRYY